MTVLVLGSINVDIVCQVDHLPRCGETVMALDTARVPGGKGANQAIAAALSGTRVEMVGLVGDDADGRFMVEQLAASGVGVTGVGVHARIATGTAVIAVDRQGENLIIVASGANAHVEAPVEPRSGILLVQAETPLVAIAETMRAAVGKVVFNAAPVVPGAEALFPLCDVVIVNETELSAFANGPASDAQASAEAKAQSLLSHPGQWIIVTLGRAGVMLVGASETVRLAGHTMDTVDTTGAGDCFCGVFAAGLDHGFTIEQAARSANAAAALSTARRGAGSSMPSADEVLTFLETLTFQQGADNNAA